MSKELLVFFMKMNTVISLAKSLKKLLVAVYKKAMTSIDCNDMYIAFVYDRCHLIEEPFVAFFLLMYVAVEGCKQTSLDQFMWLILPGSKQYYAPILFCTDQSLGRHSLIKS